MASRLTLSCDCAAQAAPVVRELRGALAVLACSACGSELQVRLGVPPVRSPEPGGAQSGTARPGGAASQPGEGFARVLASGRAEVHDAYVRASFEHGRLATAAACYRPLLADPTHGLLATRAMRQISTLALVPIMSERRRGSTRRPLGWRRIGQLAVVLVGLVGCLRLQLGYWRERVARGRVETTEVGRGDVAAVLPWPASPSDSASPPVERSLPGGWRPQAVASRREP